MSIITREFKVKAKGLKFPEGPISMNDGSIILVEIARGTLSKIKISGETEVIANLGGGLTELLLDQMDIVMFVIMVGLSGKFLIISS